MKPAATQPDLWDEGPALQEAMEQGRALAQQYLASTGMAATEAAEVLLWLWREPVLTEETVGRDALSRARELDERLSRRRRYAELLGAEVSAAHLELAAAELPGGPEEARALRTAWAASAPTHTNDAEGRLSWMRQLPAFERDLLALEAIIARAESAQEQLRGPKLEGLLGDGGPQRRLSPYEWAVTHHLGPQESLELALGIERLAREEAERRASVLEQQLQDARRPTLRAGTATLRAMLRTDVHVAAARRKGRASGTLTQAEAEARKLFKYEPLGWAERLCVHGLASLAREQGLLDSHPWALSRRPVKGQPSPRVKLPFPGISELAKVIGYQPNADGKIERAHRASIEKALQSLCAVPRFIAVPILEPPKKKGGRWTEDLEVTQTLWVEASAQLIGRGVYLNLHPAAIASHLESFVSVPDLAARYEAARESMNKRQMRDEWAIADDYLRLLARAQVASVRGRDEAKLLPLPADVALTEGMRTVSARVAQETVITTLGLETTERKRGARHALDRVQDAWAFCQQMGSLLTTPVLTDGVWELELPHPDAAGADSEQIVMLAEAGK